MPLYLCKNRGSFTNIVGDDLALALGKPAERFLHTFHSYNWNDNSFYRRGFDFIWLLINSAW